MKVLHVYKTYLPDNFQGVARVIWEIAEGAPRYSITSEVFSLSPNADPPAVTVGSHISHRAPQDVFIASAALSLGAFSRFRELARTADLIHYHFPWPMMDLLQMVRDAARPSIVTYHSDVVRQRILGKLYAPLMHRFLGRMDRIVATSPQYAQTSPVLKRHGDKVVVIPIGINEAKPIDAERLAFWRKRIEGRFLLFVGALRYYKGIRVLAEAARATGLPVVVVGTGELAAELAQLHPPNMMLLGELDDDDKNALLSLCDGFVFPSHVRSEAFGVALLEAARAGKPMISCEIGTGTSYVNVNEDTGFSVAPSSAEALGAAMLRLWNDPTAARMGENARRRYEGLFTGDRMAHAYSELYRQILAGSGQG